MADETWPTTLPQYVDREGFSFTLTASSLSTAMSTGYDKRRKKFTGQYAVYSVSMQCTVDQFVIFEQFFNNNLGYGTVEFDFPDPLFIEDTIEVRVVCGATTVPYTVTPYGETEDVVLSFEMERLISSYTAEDTTEWPSTLPQCPRQTGYSVVTQAGVIRDQDYTMGKVNVRRRFTAVIRKHSVSFIVSRTELETFFNFYASLGYGSLAFTAPFPFDSSETMRTRFDTSDGIGFDVGYFDDTDLFEVSFIWEELPLLKDYS